MRYSETNVARAVADLLSEKSLSEAQAIRGLISFLRKRRWLGRSEKILAALNRHLSAEVGRMTISATTARPLSATLTRDLQTRAAILFPGKTLDFIFREDRSLIGGFRLETEDARYDASLARSLRQLAQSL